MAMSPAGWKPWRSSMQISHEVARVPSKIPSRNVRKMNSVLELIWSDPVLRNRLAILFETQQRFF